MYIVNYFSVWPEIVFVEVCMVKKTVMVGMYHTHLGYFQKIQNKRGADRYCQQSNSLNSISSRVSGSEEREV